MKFMASPTQTLPVQFKSGHAALELATVNTGDAILIWTQNSFYRFLVTDAPNKRGHLIRGGQPVSAEEVTLIGLADASEKDALGQGSELVLGRRILFRVAETSFASQLLTSPITRFNLVKATDRRTDEFNCETWDDQAGLSPLSFDDNQEQDSVDSVFLSPWN